MVYVITSVAGASIVFILALILAIGFILRLWKKSNNIITQIKTMTNLLLLCRKEGSQKAKYDRFNYKNVMCLNNPSCWHDFRS